MLINNKFLRFLLALFGLSCFVVVLSLSQKFFAFGAQGDSAVLGWDSTADQDVFRVDASSDPTGLIPGRSGRYRIGTESVRIASITANGLVNLYSDLHVNDAVTIVGSATVQGNLALDIGLLNVLPGSVTGITETTRVLPTSTYITVLSTGGGGVNGNVRVTATPNISTATVATGATAWPNGTIIIITSTASTNTVEFQDEDTLTGSRLELGSTQRIITVNDYLILIYNSTLTKWYELAFGNN